MSPEQARGKPVDKRADIWAFGCVLYEMLTGRAVVAGETLSDMLAAILEREPDWPALPSATPGHDSRPAARAAFRRTRIVGSGTSATPGSRSTTRSRPLVRERPGRASGHRATAVLVTAMLRPAWSRARVVGSQRVSGLADAVHRCSMFSTRAARSRTSASPGSPSRLTATSGVRGQWRRIPFGRCPSWRPL